MSEVPYFHGKARGGGIVVLDARTSTIDFSLFAVGCHDELVRRWSVEQLYADARFHVEDSRGREAASASG